MSPARAAQHLERPQAGRGHFSLRKTTWEVGTELDVQSVIALWSLRANGAHEGLIARSSPMELIETLRNIAIREGFEAGRSIQELSEETGLPVFGGAPA